MTEFGKAFRAARAAGKKTFSFQGKLYTTKLKEETKAKAASTSYAKNPKNVPVPAQRPSGEVAATNTSKAVTTTVEAATTGTTNTAMAAAKAAERTVFTSPTEMDKRRAARSGAVVSGKTNTDERFKQPRKLTEMDKRRLARAGAFLKIGKTQ